MLMCALFYPLHMRPRVQRASGIPCALCFREGERFLSQLGRRASRGCETVSTVIPCTAHPTTPSRHKPLRSDGGDNQQHPNRQKKKWFFPCARQRLVRGAV